MIESTLQLLIENVLVLHKLPFIYEYDHKATVNELQASKFVAAACVA